MPENIDDIDEHVDEEVEATLEDEEVLEESRTHPEELAEATVPPEPGLENVESIQDLLAKQESQEGRRRRPRTRTRPRSRPRRATNASNPSTPG